VLKSNGINKLSRNPIYVDFGLFTIVSIIFTMNAVIITHTATPHTTGPLVASNEIPAK